MQVVIHAGAHITDENRLISCLADNREALEAIGTNIPNQGNYQKLLRDLIKNDSGAGLAPDSRDIVMDAILEGPAAERMVLSNAGFFGTPRMAMSAGALYTAAEDRLGSLSRIFMGDQIELFMGLCNPATYLPAMFEKSRHTSFDEFMRGIDPRFVRWSEMLERMRAAFPSLPITVWCNEDLPMIWGEVLREMGGMVPNAELKGEFTLLEEIMSKVGMNRFKSYVETHPGMSESQKRRVIAAFLDKFALDDAVEEVLDLPGWTDELIDELTEIYDEDVYTIGRLPGVNLIAP